MLSRNEIKFIQSLCHKKHRQIEKLFIAEGVKVVEEIIQSDYQIKKIYATSSWIEENPIVTGLVTKISEDELLRISTLQTPNKVLAVVQQKQVPLDKEKLKGITLAVDGLQDPGNLGTIIRIADWFGLQNIVCSTHTVELYNAKVIQSSMGSLVRVNVFYEDLKTFFNQANLPILGALLNGMSIYDVEQPKDCILLIGNEGNGIGEELLNQITQPVTIPRIGKAESLNAAIATGILLSHLVG